MQDLEEFSEFPEEFSEPSEKVDLRQQVSTTLVVVETAFLASISALIWLINYYFPVGPLLRIFFPIPVALSYLRWGRRTAWMTAIVASLLASVLMGPTRSLEFMIPYGLLGVCFGGLWKRRVHWGLSIAWGTVIVTLGLGFQVVLASVLLGENIWIYANQQVINLLNWIFSWFDLLLQPDFDVIQGLAVFMVVVNACTYSLLVHLAAWLLLERLGNSIPAPPEWVQVLLDYRDVP
jgi:uncharacterized protein YybS (DUF2232 family)